jgi:hypothetical protein
MYIVKFVGAKLQFFTYICETKRTKGTYAASVLRYIFQDQLDSGFFKRFILFDISAIPFLMGWLFFSKMFDADK